MNEIGLNIKVNKLMDAALTERLESMFPMDKFFLAYIEKEEYWKLETNYSIILVFRTTQSRSYAEWREFVRKICGKEPIVTTNTGKEISMGRYDSYQDSCENYDALFLDVTIDTELITDYDQIIKY